MNDGLFSALTLLAREGERLDRVYHLPWPRTAQQTACALICRAAAPTLGSFVAIVGGASSGKSTVFNNLLGGRMISQITARGHATKGLVLAAHERHRDAITRLLETHLLFPGLAYHTIEAIDGVEGAPESLAVYFHQVDSLSDVLLLDTPDFTSEAARQEGDVLLSLLPWFDRLVVVVDRERWFDRQSISELREHSAEFGQKRVVLFNQTREGALSEADEQTLSRQAERLAADLMLVLEHRRGRGLCHFPPGTFDRVWAVFGGDTRDRDAVLHKRLVEAATKALNQNEERQQRLGRLGDSLSAAAGRSLPTARECMTALMLPAEREQIEIVWRVFRASDSKAWLIEQSKRIEGALRRLPLVSAVMRPATNRAQKEAKPPDRAALGLAYFEAKSRTVLHELQRAAGGSAFWDEVRRWTGIEPLQGAFAWGDDLRHGVERDIAVFETALSRWNARVESECQGIAPHVKGAVGATVLGLAVLLVAVPGPLAALTVLSIKSALGAGLGSLAGATGAGALFGKHFGRLVEVVRERLVGSSEFTAVQRAAGQFREGLASFAQGQVTWALTEAERLVLHDDEPLHKGLRALRDAEEGRR